MRDFLPAEVRKREYVIGVIKSVYERYGFEPLETPAFENIETLLGKYGDEVSKAQKDSIYYLNRYAGTRSETDYERYLEAIKVPLGDRKAREELVGKNVKVRTMAGHGSAAEEIVQIAKAESVDLIVISTHGSTGLEHFVFGSVAEKVVRLAECPVLTVRQKK